MWTKYDYLCTNCDTLIEITTQHQAVEDPYCVCAESAVIRINKHDVTHEIEVTPAFNLKSSWSQAIVKIKEDN